MAFLIIHAGLLAFAAIKLSPTMLEPAFLASGLAHWTTGRFDPFSVNPPLPRLLASISVMAAGYEMDWSEVHSNVSRPEFGLGVAFVTANGQRTQFLVTLARISCIPVSLLAAWCCWLWSKQLWKSDAAGLLSLCVWCFEPILTGHNCLLTADGASASAAMISGYACWRWVHGPPNWCRCIIAGIALGAACCTKFTLLPLVLLWLGGSFFSCFWRAATFRRHLLEWIVVIVGAMYVINAGYAFSGCFRRVDDLSLDSRVFHSITHSSDGIRRQFLGSVRLSVPADFLQGLDLQMQDVEGRTEMNYAHGSWRQRGWWYFYLYAFAIKTTHGLHLLLLLACLMAIRSAYTQGILFGELSIVMGIVTLLFVLSIHVSLNRHSRYALPAAGLACVLIGRCLSGLSPVRPWKIGYICVALGIIVSNGIAALPDGFSYFNHCSSLIAPDDWHLIDSNVDWGQDLHRLAEWRKTIPSSEKVYVAHFNRIDPRLFGLDCVPLEVSDDFSSLEELSPGYYVISASLLRGMPWYSLERLDGTVQRYRFGVFCPFLDVEPVDHVGRSLKVYYVPLKSGVL